MTKSEMLELAAAATHLVTKAPPATARGIKKPKRMTKAHAKRVEAIVARFIPQPKAA
jgi:hypothetical protein